MFEKEAEEEINKEHWNYSIFKDLAQEYWQKGAEFGYNKGKEEIKLLKETHKQSLKILTDQIEELHKANEWHYPSKGEYPNDFEDVLICFLTEDDAKDCVRGWYEYDFENDKHIFKYLNILEIQCLKTVFAWKKLVLPELPKESE